MDGLIAVRSRIKAPQVLTYGGRPFHFGGEGEKDHIRILPADMQGFIETRHISRHKSIENEKGEVRMLPQLEAVMLFEVIPLDEALRQGAALEENPSLVEARRRTAEREAQKAALKAEMKEDIRNEILADLRKQGVKLPKNAGQEE